MGSRRPGLISRPAAGAMRRRRGGSRLCVLGGTIGEESGAVTCSRHGRLSAVTCYSQSPDAASNALQPR